MRTSAAVLVLPLLMLQAGCAVTFDERVARFVEQSVARENAEKAAHAEAAKVYAATSGASLTGYGLPVTPAAAALAVRQGVVAGSEDCVSRNAKAALVRGSDGAVRITRAAGPVSVECSIAPSKDAAEPTSLSRL
jgi:hypothetical protein